MRGRFGICKIPEFGAGSRPNSSRGSWGVSVMAQRPHRHQQLQYLAWALPALGPIACTPTDASPRTLQAPPPSQSAPLIVSPEALSLGTLAPGESGRGTLTLRNRRSEPMTVARVATTCPCIRLAPLPLTVAPNGEATLQIEFDPSDQPDFRGALGVEIQGLDAGGQTLFKTKVLLQVASPPVKSG